MLLSTLMVVGIPSEIIIEQPIKVSGFGSSASFTIGYNNLEPMVQPLDSLILRLEAPITCYQGDHGSTSTKVSPLRITNA